MYGAYLPQYTKDEIQGEGVFQELKNGVFIYWRIIKLLKLLFTFKKKSSKKGESFV
jgi:hypothetical protein